MGCGRGPYLVPVQFSNKLYELINIRIGSQWRQRVNNFEDIPLKFSLKVRGNTAANVIRALLSLKNSHP